MYQRQHQAGKYQMKRAIFHFEYKMSSPGWSYWGTIYTRWRIYMEKKAEDNKEKDGGARKGIFKPHRKKHTDNEGQNIFNKQEHLDLDPCFR